MGVESSLVAQNAPCDAGELVGQRNGEFVSVQPLRRGLEPRTEAVSRPILWAHQEDLRGLDEERPQIFATALGNAAQNWPTARAVLSRNETEPGAKVATSFKSLSCTDRSDQSGRDQWPDTGH